jgi:hypothetical protein
MPGLEGLTLHEQVEQLAAENRELRGELVEARGLPRRESAPHRPSIEACVAAAQVGLDEIRAQRARTIGRNSQLLGEQESGALRVLRKLEAMVSSSNDPKGASGK